MATDTCNSKDAPPLPPLRVLLCDDDAVVGPILEMGLEALGFYVRMAQNAVDALCVFAQDDFDIIIADYGMPGTNGVQLLRQIRETCPTVVTVILSGLHSSQLPTEEGLECVDEWFMKPIDMRRFGKRIRELYLSSPT